MTASKPLDSRSPGSIRVCVFALALTCSVAGPTQAAIIHFASTVGDSTAVDSVAAAPEAEPAKPDSTPAPPELPLTDSTSVATPELDNTLPFAQNELPISYPQVSITFGVAVYSSGLVGVEEAFRKFENAYSAAGYPISSTANSSLGPMYLATLTLWLSHVFDVACQLGRTGNEDGQVRLLGGIFSARYIMPTARNVSLSLGVGGGESGFSITRRYGQQVSAVDGSGGFYTLDSIELKGSGPYWTGQGGVTLRLGPHGALSGLIQYVGASDVSTESTRVGTISVNTSGTMFGASFALFY